MSSQGNVFSALQPEKRKKKTNEVPKNTMFASFVNKSSTSAWGDDSDDEIYVAATSVTESSVVAEEGEEDEDDDDEEDEEDESEDEEPMASVAPKKTVIPHRTLSKKEKKELEMKEFEAALADLGIQAQDTQTSSKKENEIVKVETPLTTGASDKKKKKKKGKKPCKILDPETEMAEIVDIKAVPRARIRPRKTKVALTSSPSRGETGGVRYGSLQSLLLASVTQFQDSIK
ncbi:unnamed protein product [Peronospora belbahrii]|uniref:Uncharacterized protein n=1 Tax=Peronospora belbahrii TaxID=622444 RepID=A0AAU9KZP4_9STRA|nr:unnamed protein product [Peronospora belbahrii]CAH0515623.1 unnamed protein product [Peronospora belbahrii]